MWVAVSLSAPFCTWLPSPSWLICLHILDTHVCPTSQLSASGWVTFSALSGYWNKSIFWKICVPMVGRARGKMGAAETGWSSHHVIEGRKRTERWVSVVWLEHVSWVAYPSHALNQQQCMTWRINFSGVWNFTEWNKMLGEAWDSSPKSCSDCKNLDFSEVSSAGKGRVMVSLCPWFWILVVCSYSALETYFSPMWHESMQGLWMMRRENIRHLH